MTSLATRRTFVASVLAAAGVAAAGKAISDEEGPMPGATSAILDREWKITRIGDLPVADEGRPTLTLNADGSFHGRACNAFRGSYEIDGGKLSFGRAAATMMACAEPLMAQESALFSALEKVAGFSLTPDGALRLSDEAGNMLIEADA